VRAAAATGVDLIITPEGALEGYVINEVGQARVLDSLNVVTGYC
jgi:predicted amidohydrolase